MSDELHALLAEPLDAARERERGAFDAIAGGRRSIVLYGAGNLGRKALTGLRAEGYEVLAFVDNARDKQGLAIDGLPILSSAEATARYPREAWIVTIWGAGSTHRYEQTRDVLHRAGVAAVAPAATLFWKHPQRFLPHWSIDLPSKVIAARDEILACAAMLADDASRAELARQLRFRLHADGSAIGEPEPDEYFPRDLFARGAREAFIDCGAYDGDTLQLFVDWAGPAFDGALVLEPDSDNRAALERRLAAMSPSVRARVRVSPLAAHAHRTTLRFTTGAGVSSRRSAEGAEVAAAPLDELAEGLAPTLIKMDIEGAELDALAGARALIAAHRPRLSVCVYHVQDHLWRVPLLIHELSPTQPLHLRNHGREAWDVVCYATRDGA